MANYCLDQDILGSSHKLLREKGTMWILGGGEVIKLIAVYLHVYL